MNKNRWVFIFCFFLLFFPKGGFKIKGIPITWGYILLGLFSIYWCIKKSKKIHRPHLYAYILTIPFQLTLIISLFFLEYSCSLGQLTACIINIIFLPFICFIVLSDYIYKMDLDYFLTILKKGIFFIAIYGIFLFFYKFITGKFIEIPFLTMNFSDIGTLENKHINRGFLFKLISTYNNGNIYGICLLMLLPLYQFLEHKNSRKIIVIISLILTLSRIVWTGLLFIEFFYFIISKKNKKELYKEFIPIFISFLSFGIFFIIFFPQVSSLFKIEKLLNLGGRINNYNLESLIYLLPNKGFRGISEMTYNSTFKNFGVIGLLLFIVGLLSSMIIYFLQRNKIKNKYSRYIILGILTYLLCAIIEGAFIFIPTIFFFWFLSSLLLRISYKTQPTIIKTNSINKTI